MSDVVGCQGSSQQCEMRDDGVGDATGVLMNDNKDDDVDDDDALALDGSQGEVEEGLSGVFWQGEGESDTSVSIDCDNTVPMKTQTEFYVQSKNKQKAIKRRTRKRSAKRASDDDQKLRKTLCV